jgi:hypothetical protein
MYYVMGGYDKENRPIIAEMSKWLLDIIITSEPARRRRR